MNEKGENRLLIVDDSSMVRRAIARFLEEFDIEVIAFAEDGNKALDLFKKLKPDLVTLDVTMPGLDGLEVLSEMVKINTSAKIMVITALVDKTLGLTAIRKGAKSYLTKPFSPQKLKNAFTHLLNLPS
jgi:two-component system chemotaxis response regulator CheY